MANFTGLTDAKLAQAIIAMRLEKPYNSNKLALVLYKSDIFLEPRIFEVRLLEILKIKKSGFQVIS